VVGESAFPFMSKVKSAQQLCGLLLKHYLSLHYGVSATKVKMVTVMPCYDKKLEAVRPDFALGDQADQVKEVDTVLATHELVTLIDNLAINNGLTPSIESFSQIIPYNYQH
jgi:iron only hydrogenase large subunit-like protein